MNWPKDLKDRVKENIDLSRHTTFKIGGRAKYWLEPRDINELKSAVSFAKNKNIAVFVIGAGSNLLVKDKGFNGLIIKLNSPEFLKIKIKNSKVYAGAGVKLSHLIKFAQTKSLGGLELFAGIPGTLGGALAMNAGAFGRSICGLINQVTVMDFNGKINNLEKKDIDFSYRRSGLADYIILEATLCLRPARGFEILKNIKAQLNLRRLTQDYSSPSAGCIFKNPKEKPAGWLIDACGLKGKTCGQAAVSYKHANFILNIDKARARDVIRLMRLIQKKVKTKFGIKLEPEIKILG